MALLIACVLVSLAATMPAIIIECRYESAVISTWSNCMRMPCCIQPEPEGSLRILLSTVPANCPDHPHGVRHLDLRVGLWASSGVDGAAKPVPLRATSLRVRADPAGICPRMDRTFPRVR